MGVHGLWQILASVCQRCSLEEMRGKRLAVDLSWWVCEFSQTKPLAAAVQRPYLRNLLYRLLRLYGEYGVGLVFVIDGDATPIKWATMDRRMAASGQTRDGAGRGRKTGVRHHLNSKVRECCELLDAAGIPYVKSQGEAEAMCALLNQNGLVDGVISEDSDALLYGATVIYKHLSTAERASHVDRYTMASVTHSLGLSRKDLVAMAVLLGCDYMPQGVPGVGKEKVLQLVREKVDLLDVVQGRTTGPQSISQLPAIKLIRKAMDTPSWQRNADMVVEEFMVPKDDLGSGFSKMLNTKQPNIVALQEACHKLLEWSHQYTLEKSYLLLSQWAISVRSRGLTSDVISPISIDSQRVLHGVQHYSVSWRSCLPRVNEDGHHCCGSEEWQFKTLQRTEHMEEYWPVLCQEFQERKQAQKKHRRPPKPRKQRTAAHKDPIMCEEEDLVQAMASMSHDHTSPISSPSSSPLKRSSPSKINSPSKHHINSYSQQTRTSMAKPRALSWDIQPVLDCSSSSSSSSSDEETLPLFERLQLCVARKPDKSTAVLPGHQESPIVLSD